MRVRAAFQIAVMAERREIEIRAQFAIGADQQIEVEGGRDALRVVIGGYEDRRILDHVDADDEACALRPARAQNGAAGPARHRGSRLPMVEPGKNPRRGAPARPGGNSALEKSPTTHSTRRPGKRSRSRMRASSSALAETSIAT